METLSDHRYILFWILRSAVNLGGSVGRLGYSKWSFKEFDKPLFNVLLEFKGKYMDKDQSVEELAGWLAETLREACDLAAKRVASRPGRSTFYWWNEKIATARRRCIVRIATL